MPVYPEARNLMASTVYVVHCIDTEGPLYESLEATFERLEANFGLSLEPNAETLRRLQAGAVDLGGLEAAVRRFVDPHLLAYNDTWDKIDSMLEDCMSGRFRCRMADSAGGGWVYNWFCVDHVDLTLIRGAATLDITTYSTITAKSCEGTIHPKTGCISTITRTASGVRRIAAPLTGGRHLTASIKPSPAASSTGNGSRLPTGLGSMRSGQTATGSWSSSSPSTTRARL